MYRSFTNIAILLCLALLLAQTASAQTVFQGSSWSEFPGGAKAVCADDDIDNDNDGLIELCYLEDVNAIRYNLQGNTYKDSMDATGVVTGCPSRVCNGYELVRDLDFNDDDSYESTSTNNVKVNWTTGTGWPMIKDMPTSIVSRFIGTLEGNGHTISNLFINRTASVDSSVGFIEDLGGRIYNLGLSDIDISITIDALLGAHSAALVGNLNYGTIANCYVQGKIKYQGGPNLFLNSSASFVAENNGSIINSYSNVNMSVTGHRLFGMFVGFTNTGRSISDSYAIGSITHSSNFVHNHSGSLVASYTNMGGTESVYPLAQLNFGLISRSYWDSSKWRSTSDPTGDGTIINSKGFSTEALQAATAPNNVDPNKPYYEWSEDNWDFGTSKQYPALRHARGNNDSFPACGTSQQPACGALLPGQSVIPVDNSRPKIAPQQDITIREGETSIVQLEVSDEDVNDELSLLLSTLDKTQDFIEFTPAKIEVSTNNRVVRDPQMLTIEGIKAGEATLSLVAIDNTGIRNTTSAEVWLKVTVDANAVPEVTAPALVTVKTDREATFNVTVSDGNVADVLTLKLTAANPRQDIVELVTTNVVVATNTTETRAVQTLTIRGLKEGTTTLQIVADDGLTQSQPVSVDVIVAANAVPQVTVPASVTARAGREATFNVTVSDADIDDVLTIELTAADLDQDFVELVTKTVEVATNSSETRTVQTLTIIGSKEGTATLNVVVGDGVANSQPAAVKVTVAANAVPEVTAPASVTVREGREVTFEVTVSDADVDDGGQLSLSTNTERPGFIKLINEGRSSLMDTTKAGYVQTFKVEGLKPGTVNVEIVATDGVDRSQPASVQIIVQPNEAPTITITPEPSDIRLLEGTSKTLWTVTATDADDTDIRVRVRSKHSMIATAKLGADQGSGYPLTIKAKEAGTAEIEVSANDRRKTTNSETTKTFTVTVVANQAPMVVIQNVTTQVVTIGETLSLETGEFFADPDDAELSYEVSGFPDGYNFSFSTTGTLMVTPRIEDASKNKLGLPLTVEAIDSGGSSAQAMFILLVDDETDATIRIRNVGKWQLQAEISDEMDANGIAERNYRWFRNEDLIENETTKTYEIRDTKRGRAGGTEYRVDVTFVDNIGQEVTTSSGVYTVGNEAPVIGAISRETVNEGETVSIATDASDANHDNLTYTWRVTQGAADLNEFDDVDEGATLGFKVPADWIEDTSTRNDVTKTLQLEVMVSDGSLSTTRTAEVIATKVNNGVSATTRPTIDRTENNMGQTVLVLETGTDIQAIADDPDGNTTSPGEIRYQWQWCQSPCSSWMDISDATGSTYAIPDSISGTQVMDNDRFRIEISYTDGQGYGETIFSKATSTSADVKVRTKIFLEGPLQ